MLIPATIQYFCRPKFQDLFTRFRTSVAHISLPTKFTFPFFYEPHPLCVLAAKELQNRIEKEQENWGHNFGFDPENKVALGGKMFGVLVVKNAAGEVGYLSAFSGKLNDTPWPKNFVPAINDLPENDNFLSRGMRKIAAMGEEIRALENDPNLAKAEKHWQQTKTKKELEIERFRAFMQQRKKYRKHLRKVLATKLSADGFERLTQNLVKESYHYQHEFKLLQSRCADEIEIAKRAFFHLKNNLEKRKEARAQFSAELQNELFTGYQFLNAKGKKKSVLQIFNEKNIDVPPAGAGDCAAPKLLQYAFANNFKPLAMAEFWWGVSPKTVVRKHGNFYPACKAKCEPILGHMLQGLAVEENPMLRADGSKKVLETVYEDEHLLVVNKPHGLLSVPGKNITDSVATRMKEKYPDATGPLVVHRLDMATSGLLLIAKSLEVHHHLQAQFMQRTIKKRYVALLDGMPEKKEGVIDLPLRVDLDNRPSQMVCYEHGKRAITKFKVIEEIAGKTRVHLFPYTGRTHQLRVHMAHSLGANTPIVGDAIYGQKANRLHLHAEFLEFVHPASGKKMRVKATADF